MRHLAAVVAFLCPAIVLAQPLTTAIVYQGVLESGGAPVTTAHNVRYSLWDAEFGGNNVGSTLCNTVLPVNGRFASTLDFGPVFNGQKLFLQLEIRVNNPSGCSDPVGFTPLSPRQEMTIAPYAAYAMTAATAITSNTLNGQNAFYYTNASNLNAGTIPDARLATNVGRTNSNQTYTGAVTFSNAASSFAGSGSLLTSLDASALAFGTVPDARLPGTLARTNQANLFTADQAITGNLRVNSSSSLAALHVGGEGYFTNAVRVGHTDSPRAGVIRFNQTTRDFEGYNGAWWRSLTSTTVQAPENIVSFSTPGSTSWIVPAGVFSIGIEGWGGGGGGGSSGTQLPQVCAGLYASGGGGGGSGGYGVHIVNVMPGDTIGVLVGSGGNGGSGGGHGVQGGTTFVTINGFLVLQATGGGAGLGGGNEPIGSPICATASANGQGGSGGSASGANFVNTSGNPGVFSRRAYNAGGCGFPTAPDIRPGCPGPAGPAVGSVSPSASSAGQGGVGGVFGGSSGPGENGSPGRVRILY